MPRNCYYTGAAGDAKQKETYTPVVTGLNNFTIAAGPYSVTYPASAATVANVVDGLYTLLTSAACPLPLRHGVDVNWSKAGGSASLTAEAVTAGELFDFDLSATGGDSIGAVVDRAPSGPKHIDLADNWDTGVAPVTGDSLFFEGGPWYPSYGLEAFSAATFAQVVWQATGSLGLPLIGGTGYSYEGYLPRHFKATMTTVRLGIANGDQVAYSNIRLNAGSANCTMYLEGLSSSEEPGALGVEFVGTGTGNNIYVRRGSIDLGTRSGGTCAVANLYLGAVDIRATDARAVIGKNCTVTNLYQYAGGVAVYGTVTNDLGSGGHLQKFSGGTVTNLPSFYTRTFGRGSAA